MKIHDLAQDSPGGTPGPPSSGGIGTTVAIVPTPSTSEALVLDSDEARSEDAGDNESIHPESVEDIEDSDTDGMRDDALCEPSPTPVAEVVTAAPVLAPVASPTTPAAAVPLFTPQELEAVARQDPGQLNSLQAEARRLQRQAADAGPEGEELALMVSEIQAMLALFGIPYITSPSEADAQCGYMNAVGLVDGVCTEDSDVFLFGAKTVYRGLFGSSQNNVVAVTAERVEEQLGVDRAALVAMALLLGSDYTEGVANVGPVGALEVLAAFPLPSTAAASEEHRILATLDRFKEWVFTASTGGDTARPPRQPLPKDANPSAAPTTTLDDASDFVTKFFKYQWKRRRRQFILGAGFPSRAVVSAYINPALDSSKEPFTFGDPRLAPPPQVRGAEFRMDTTNHERVPLPHHSAVLQTSANAAPHQRLLHPRPLRRGSAPLLPHGHRRLPPTALAGPSGPAARHVCHDRQGPCCRHAATNVPRSDRQRGRRSG
eukprot:TRINITY_DN16020_c0_g1_i1.p1 TRINITY_DN16020_c0_g1~~TRINITY_DN16020_c0_g1_i1.p1  ORF type:complete len:555 (+),score=87.66 TRINITY_DN16020_c0_g1_i1:201-1667(+)